MRIWLLIFLFLSYTASAQTVVENIAALRNKQGKTGQSANVLGYYTAKDGGGGLFNWKEVNANDNNGDTIKAGYSSSGAWIREIEKEVDSRMFGMMGNKDAAYTQEQIDQLLNTARSRKLPVRFSNGTHIFPKNFGYNSGFDDLIILGEDKHRTIITTRTTSNTMRIVERVNLQEPKPAYDGFFRVDVISGNNHSDWIALDDPEVDMYIKIKNGGPSPASFDEIKSEGYLTELDVSKPEPEQDGLYVIGAIDFVSSGGAYSHTGLIYAKTVPVVNGTILQRRNGQWSRYAASLGFIFSGRMKFENIQFNDISFYLFTPSNKLKPNQDFLILENCIFRHVPRICSYERGFEMYNYKKQWTDLGGFVKEMDHHFTDARSFNYKKISITNCDFSYIHTSIFWNFPPTDTLIVKNNNIHDCYTMIAGFAYEPMVHNKPGISDALGYADRGSLQLFENNIVNNLRVYSPLSSGGNILFRSNGNATYRDNEVLDGNMMCFYVGGANNLLEGNIIKPFIKYYPGEDSTTYATMSIFEMKGRPAGNGADRIIGNRITKSAYVQPINMLFKNIPTEVRGNLLMTAGWIDNIISTDTAIDKAFIYIVRDLGRFQQLAGDEMYEASIKVGSKVYWDIQQNKWMQFHKNFSSAYAIKRTNDDANYTQQLDLVDNKIWASGIISVLTGNFSTVNIQENTIFSNLSLFLVATGHSIKRINAENNTIYRGHGANTFISKTEHIDHAVYRDNTFYYAVPTGLQIRFTNQCDWINNKVLPDKRFADISVVKQMPISINYNAVEFISTNPSGSLLNIEGGSIDSYLSRGGALSFNGVAEIDINGTHFRARNITDASTNNKRAVVYVRETINPTKFSISNITLEFDAGKERALIATDNNARLTAGELTLQNIQSSGPYKLNKILRSEKGSSARIGKLKKSKQLKIVDTDLEQSVMRSSEQLKEK
jgi:hypothetical protein